MPAVAITKRNGKPWSIPAIVLASSALAAIGISAVAGTPDVPAKLPPAATTQIDFTKDIQPLFESHCYKCHGEKKQESGFRLDDADRALKGGDLGPAYIPGKSADSSMVKYVAGLDEDIVMPPADSNIAKLSPSEIGLLRAWIDQGAQRPKGAAASKSKKPPGRHWAFRRPVSPKLPETQAHDWARNAIDSFVLEQLKKAKLTPAEEADRPTLIRRLSLDLTGLPPTLEEVQRFVNDSSPDGYQHLVERLLESPHYGERWALWWLDLARYADTNGYEIDRPRSIWLYRDWVVSAFNDNMPFDQFTIEQLAGDQLPNATQSQRIATGFHRNTFINEEGGHNWEQFRWESIVDRVSTTSTVFLGLTMACAQCHDHKYDPISQREYYEFFAFFNDDDEPIVDVPQPEITAERQRIEAQISRLESKLVGRLAPAAGDAADPASLSQRFEEWRAKAAADVRTWNVAEPMSWTSEHNVTLNKLEDMSLLATGDNPEVDAYEIKYRVPAGKITGIRLEALPDPSLPLHGPGRGYLKDDGTFLLSEITVKARNAGSDAGKNDAQPIKLVHPTASMNPRIIDQAIDGKKLTGWHIRGGGAGRRHVAAFEFAKPFAAPPGAELDIRLLQDFAHEQTLGRFRIWVTTDQAPLIASDMPLEVEKLLLKPPAQWSADDRKDVQKYYVSIAPELRKEYKRISDLRASMPAQPTTMVLVERPTPRKTHQHIRGDFARPGQEVAANVPHFLPPLPADAPRNRLTLARWLVDKQNPLTARVVVNQIWQCYFGRGLVNTPENFGTQGAEPSDQQLLDWLACRFMEDGWDLKQLHRLIVSSSTYRQSSVTNPTKQAIDPENVLLSRGPRFRLPAETIRDIGLVASGLLNPKLGGPSIFTPQPAGALTGAFGGAKWPDAPTPDRYRRALYTHRKRATPYAAFAAFDGPPHSTCVMRRVCSNTPLQALAQLNDEMEIEACQALAKRIVSEEAGDETARLDHGFQLCLTRHPRDEERRLLLSYFRQQQQHFQSDKQDAATIAGGKNTGADKPTNIADLAAWTLVSRAMLNLDEAITKE